MSLCRALDELPQPDSGFERDRWRIVFRVALEAAAPLIAAAQREADAELADEAGAVCTGNEGTSCWFSAVLRTQQQRGTP